MKKRVGAIEEFSIGTLSQGTGLHCALVVSGWIDPDAVRDKRNFLNIGLRRSLFSHGGV